MITLKFERELEIEMKLKLELELKMELELEENMFDAILNCVSFLA